MADELDYCDMLIVSFQIVCLVSRELLHKTNVGLSLKPQCTITYFTNSPFVNFLHFGLLQQVISCTNVENVEDCHKKPLSG